MGSSLENGTLIVGAGVAGLTLAALMKQRGEEPVVVEKQSLSSFEDAGYMLGLLPLGSRVLNALGRQQEYLDRSCAMKNYNIHDGTGEALNSYPLTKINEQFGPYRGISRVELIKLLRESADDIPIRFETTVDELNQNSDSVVTTFNDGSKEKFELVVIADGLHSQTKKQILGEDEYSYTSTGWGGWVTWIDKIPEFAHSYHEYWGAGHFLGLYPVKEHIGAFLGGPLDEVKQAGRKSFVEELQQTLENSSEAVDEALHSFKTMDEEEAFFWDFHDCRTEKWTEGRVVLLGDAATGFLPTAGVGASMAMDSAAALNDELSRADDDHLDYALQLFENRQRPKVEKAQEESRDLGKWMFVDSSLMAWGRDKMLNFYTLDMMLDGLESIMMGE